MLLSILSAIPCLPPPPSQPDISLWHLVRWAYKAAKYPGESTTTVEAICDTHRNCDIHRKSHSSLLHQSENTKGEDESVSMMNGVCNLSVYLNKYLPSPNVFHQYCKRCCLRQQMGSYVFPSFASREFFIISLVAAASFCGNRKKTPSLPVSTEFLFSV